MIFSISTKIKDCCQNQIFFLEEIALIALGIQNLFEFHMIPALRQSLEDFPLELKFIKLRCLTEMGKGEKNIHLKEEHTQLGMIQLSESEPSHLFLFSYI